MTQGCTTVTVVAASLSVPANPSGLAATSVESTQVVLTWTSSPGAVFYDLERKTTAGYAPLGTVLTPGFTDRSVIAGTTYTYRLKARNAQGSSGGVELTVTIPAVIVPAIPGDPTYLNFTPNSSGGVFIIWSAVTGATEYVLERKSNGIYQPLTITDITAYTDNSTVYSTTDMFVC